MNKKKVHILNHDFVNDFHIIAGPCSVESKDQFLSIAQKLKSIGVKFLRGGIYKLRTHPDSFQGHGSVAYPWAVEVKKHLDMGFVSEVTDPRQISDMYEVIDCFQVGARNMYNYDLLKELGKTDKPVLLKRAFSATIEEWIYASEYIRKSGNENIILCERGIRTFETKTRNTLDLNAVAYVKKYSDLPVMSDPSHGTGRADLVHDMAMASVTAGATSLLVEVHENPSEALSDKDQAMNIPQFEKLYKDCNALFQFLNKDLK